MNTTDVLNVGNKSLMQISFRKQKRYFNFTLVNVSGLLSERHLGILTLTLYLD